MKHLCAKTTGVIRYSEKSYKFGMNEVAIEIIPETTCEGNTGKIISDGVSNKICLDDGIQVADTGYTNPLNIDYVMTNVEGNIFGTYSAQTAEIPVVITVTKNVIAWNNLKNGKSRFCFFLF